MRKRVPAADLDALLAPSRPIAVRPVVVQPVPALPVEYRKSAAPELPQPYTLPPQSAARRHARILNSCVVGGRRKPG
ncbi:hypothetical protein [Paraburkholderia solisilvae]|uniref:Uncharacterized protein n=1 Tax=Paraburkholderia solisilvae TaxID=624376 RepID=A0A6J5ECU5_9BURK|nr:hypothetical protein [Paraburkholderia solisilvae]CAB3762945.1 hypothetical protein LMG29739_03991 [Paraburkholderia solisilvae]